MIDIINAETEQTQEIITDQTFSDPSEPSDCKTELDIINYKKSRNHITDKDYFNSLVETYLHKEFYDAIRLGCASTAELLIQKYDQKIDNSDSYSNSLYVAFYSFNSQPPLYRLIKLILDQGANINFPKNNPFARAIIKAINAKDLKIVKLLLEYPELELNINEQHYSDNANPLSKAIANNNNTVITKLLLQHHADPNIHLSTVNLLYWGASVTCFETLLGKSIQVGNLDITKLLLQYKADPNIPSTNIEKSRPFYCSEDYNHFPLQQAVIDSNLELARLLLEYDADPNVSMLYPEHDLGQFDLLMISISKNNLDMFGLLLSYGADPNGHSSSKSPIVEAVKKNKLAMIELLLSYSQQKPLNEENISLAIIEAVKLASSEILNLLFSFYPEINQNNLNNKCAFIQAVKSSDTDIVTLLIEHNFSIDGDCYQSYALNHAIENKNPSMIRLLVDNEANVNLVNYANKTPLMLAVENSLAQEVEILLKKGADPNYIDSNSYSVGEGVTSAFGERSQCFSKRNDKYGILQTAVIGNDLKIIKLLLDYGADVNLMTSHGWLPITTAVLFSLSCHDERPYNFDLAKLLLSFGADQNSKYHGIDLVQLTLNTAVHMRKVHEFMNECIEKAKQNIESPWCLPVIEKSQKTYEEIARDNKVSKAYDFIKALVEKGYTISRFNDVNNLLYIYEHSSLELAVRQNDGHAVELLSRANISDKSIIRAAYKLAVEDNNEAMMGLLSAKFDINAE